MKASSVHRGGSQMLLQLCFCLFLDLTWSEAGEMNTQGSLGITFTSVFWMHSFSYFLMSISKVMVVLYFNISYC